MTREELKVIITALKSNYKDFGVTNKEQFDFWYQMLQDIEYTTCQAAVMKLCATCKFTPNIAHIREAVTELENPQVLMTDSEAWGEVKRVIRYFGSYREKEALADLPSNVADMVRRLGYSKLCNSTDEMADRAHFTRMWNAQAKQTKHNQALPEGIKNKLGIDTSDLVKKLSMDKERIT